MSDLVQLTDYQAKFFAHELERSYANDHVGKLAGLLFDEIGRASSRERV